MNISMSLNAVMRGFYFMRAWQWLVLITSITPITANADDYWYSGYEIGVGIAWHEITLDVTHHDEDANLGGMTDGGSVQPRLSLISPFNKLSEDGRFGYHIEYGLDRVEFNRQRLGSSGGSSSKVNLGTHASGYFFAVTPTLLWDALRLDEHKLTLGIGTGLGYTTLKGDMILTEEPQKPTHHFNVSGGDISIGVLAAYHYKNWNLAGRSYGTNVVSHNLDYSVWDDKIELVYEIKL